MDNIPSLNELFSTKMCSPIIIFAIISVIFGISLYNTRTTLKKFNSNKMDNLFNIYSLHEVKLLLILGVILYGLCQYNQVNLAWIFMFLPVIYLMIKNILIFIFIQLAHQNAPKDVSTETMQSYGMSPQMQEAIRQVEPQLNKTINMGSSPVQHLLNGQQSQNEMQAPLNQVSGMNMGGMNSMGSSF
jgi:hypothetical protein